MINCCEVLYKNVYTVHFEISYMFLKAKLRKCLQNKNQIPVYIHPQACYKRLLEFWPIPLRPSCLHSVRQPLQYFDSSLSRFIGVMEHWQEPGWRLGILLQYSINTYFSFIFMMPPIVEYPSCTTAVPQFAICPLASEASEAMKLTSQTFLKAMSTSLNVPP